jgi:hypothetical protein
MSVWAAQRLFTTDEFAALREKHFLQETDADVRREWVDAQETTA